MIFLIKAKSEQISLAVPCSSLPGSCLNMEYLLSGTAKHPTIITGFKLCKMRTRSWSVQKLSLFIIPCSQLPSVAVLLSTTARHEFMLQDAMGHLKLQRACFIKHILLPKFPLMQHYCILPAYKTLSFTTSTEHQTCERYTLYIVLAVWFSYWYCSNQDQCSTRPYQVLLLVLLTLIPKLQWLLVSYNPCTPDCTCNCRIQP